MTKQTKIKGNQAESLARNYLKNKGYEILGQNLYFRYGEIDILAVDHNELVVVEVKYKQSADFGTAEEMITPAKQNKLINLAKIVGEQYLYKSVRIDVVAINGGQINHLVNALEE